MADSTPLSVTNHLEPTVAKSMINATQDENEIERELLILDARVTQEGVPFNFASTDGVAPQKITMVKAKNDFLYPDLYGKMCHVKSHIDEEAYCKYWDKAKRKTNPYELVHVMGTNQTRDDKSPSYPYPEVYSPLSRAFFKMLEIYDVCDIIPDYAKNKAGVIANLAEGPGGFLEGVFKRRRMSNLHDTFHAITLFPRNRNIPGWSQLLRRKKHPLHNKNVFLHTGNLYKTSTLHTFSKKLEEKAFLVTGDGGFDYSRDFNNQEKSSFQIVFAEVTTALMIQKEGGTFICKMFDLFTYFSAQLIYLITLLYEEVVIFKPKTSRPANSERYLIAKKFRGIKKPLLQSMIHIVSNWQKYTEETEEIEIEFNDGTSPVIFESWRDGNPFQLLEPKEEKKKRLKKKKLRRTKTGMVMEKLPLPPTFIQELRSVNEIFARRQEKYIVATLDYIRKPSKECIRDIQSEQANEWFTEHRILTKQEIRTDPVSPKPKPHLNAVNAPSVENVQDLRGKVKEEITEKSET
jgi:23S rRNA U2552 (ribose-2'-O)-methylase RlmE/FtsJ